MEPSKDELIQLAEQVTALRAALERARNELAVAMSAEAALVERLRALGVPEETDDEKTTVDGIDLAEEADRTVPTKRIRRPEPEVPMVRAAVVGAGLTIGIAIVVLLLVSLLGRREAAPSASAAQVAPFTVASAPAQPGTPATVAARDIPPPPPPEPPQLASAVVPKMMEPSASTAPSSNTPSTGFLTIVCTPKCDAVADNGVALSPTNLVNLTVPAGQHKLVMSTNGVRRTNYVSVPPGQLREVRVSMDASDRPAPSDRGF